MRIDTQKLAKGQKVWYCYEERRDLMGPFTVKTFTSGHQGQLVILVEVGQPDRIVSLATDDDYGDPLFYDKPNRE